MSVSYRIIKHTAPVKLGGMTKFHPAPVASGKSHLKDIALHIAERTSLSTTDVIAVMHALTEAIPSHLGDGNIIKLGELGTIKLTFRTTGENTPEEVRRTNIKGINLVFRPGREMMDKISQIEIRKEKVKIRKRLK